MPLMFSELSAVQLKGKETYSSGGQNLGVHHLGNITQGMIRVPWQ